MRYTFEVALQVAMYVSKGDDCFEDCQYDLAGACEVAKEEVKEAQAIGVTVLSAEFQEFDSSNSSHACGYFLVTAEGSKKEIAKLKAHVESD